MTLRSGMTAGRLRVGAAATVLVLIASGCAITRVSVSSTGGQGDQATAEVLGVTDDGRYSLFSSWATNVVPDDTNGEADIFRHDQTTGQTLRANVAGNGTQLGGTYGGAMSESGRYVAFTTGAGLDPADTNGVGDIYVRDFAKHTTTWVSQPPPGGFLPNGGADSPAISGDGRYVSFFWRSATADPGFTLQTLYRRDRQTGTTVQIGDSGSYLGFLASSNARHYALSVGCAHGCQPVPLLVDADDAGAWPALKFAACGFDTINAISATGRYFSLRSNSGHSAPCLAPGEYVVDRAKGTAAFVSSVTFQSIHGISRDGNTVLMLADGTQTVGGTAGRMDLYLHDMAHDIDTRYVTSTTGQDQNADITSAILSTDGHEIGFQTTASDLVGGDTNSVDDVFVRPGVPRPAAP